MTKPKLPLFLIFLSIFFTLIPTGEPSHHSRPNNRAFIEASCRATQYPALCVQYLSSYIGPNVTIKSPREVAQYALSSSLYRAIYTRSFLFKVAKELKGKKGNDYQAVKDCLDQIDQSVDQLNMAIIELRRLGHKVSENALFWHINNVETWVGSALTGASSCADEFPGRRMSKLKATIKGKVLNVVEATSNALALFHRFASRYQAAGATKKP
ncbi:hypothetical protein UlMin_021159 [Ulmus minor]